MNSSSQARIALIEAAGKRRVDGWCSGYRNPDTTGLSASQLRNPVIVMKTLVGERSLGDRWWLLTAETQSRRCYLRG